MSPACGKAAGTGDPLIAAGATATGAEGRTAAQLAMEIASSIKESVRIGGMSGLDRGVTMTKGTCAPAT
ncbi:hypothetical protein U91I_02406 [alpha proteobacterium U9-1i]|nr:hypothetical protein U91I_02406 [alpha proteobacterium U9-1i]